MSSSDLEALEGEIANELEACGPFMAAQIERLIERSRNPDTVTHDDCVMIRYSLRLMLKFERAFQMRRRAHDQQRQG